MLIYLINIFLIIVWALIFRIGKKTKLKQILFVAICFLQCILISAVRYRVGYDYSMYAIGFFKMVIKGFSKMSYLDWEIGYILLNKIVGIFTAQPGAIMVVTSVIIMAGPAYLIARYSKNVYLSVFLYVNLYLFYLDMNYLRQAIAMSILCFAYGFLRDKKFWRFLLLVIIASTFHFTAIYMIPVYFVCLLKINSRTLLLYLFGLFYYFMLSDGFLKFLLSRFHTEYLDSKYIKLGITPTFAVYPLILALAAVILSYYVKNIPRNLELSIHLTLMMGFWQVVMTKHSLFERFSYYTMIFVVLAVPEMILAFKAQLKTNLKAKYVFFARGDERKTRSAVKKAKRKTTAAVYSVTAAIAVLAFVHNMVGLIIPESGAHGVLPYQTRYEIEIPSIDAFFKG
ncbi:MAG: EpsG family protein [Ruminococcaceae bacterium]|nr:EpsG family protein [Oscillospiraceae bacterium]